MASVLAELARIAGSRLTVLLCGPTGCGKELAAREVHRLSRRAGPLVAVNGSAFSESLMESELFGHVKGAYTGALRDRKGAIEVAQGGTLFLDEVADLSPRLQSLFLRVLQEREVRRVGAERSQQVDVRFLAASHRSLEALTAAGAFRQDLLYRLQGAVLTLPGLDERGHEFPFLVPRMVARLAMETGCPEPALQPGLAEALAGLAWPGHVRQLLHALERALLRCGAGPLEARHFPELDELGGLTGGLGAPPRQAWQEATRAFQRRLLLETLQRHGFQVSEAARALGLARPALYATARRLGLDLGTERRRPPRG
jgi:two-component system response regulator GlrR